MVLKIRSRSDSVLRIVRKGTKEAVFLSTLLSLVGCFGPGWRSGYKVEEGQVVHYAGFPARRNPVPEADAKSFRAINNEYGKDKAHVFLRGNILALADPATFQYMVSAYSKDKAHAWWDDKVVTDDAAHFTFIPNPENTPENPNYGGVSYAKDATKVYKHDMEVPGADPATFEYVPMFNGNYLARDKRYVFERGYMVPMKDVDGGTFHKISDVYFRDAHGVWCLALGKDTHFEKIPQADPATFVSIGKWHGKDKSHVFNETHLIEGADPATFKLPESK